MGLLSEAMQVQIMRAMAGGFEALTIPEDYEGEALPRRPADLHGPVDPSAEQKVRPEPGRKGAAASC